ncbi:hypothetical protein [Mycolicibacter minnesotensis]
MATLAVVIHCLWVRRGTWWTHWEASITLAVALEGCSILLMSPWAAQTCRPWVHHILPMWNIQQLAGHLCFIIAMGANCYHVLVRVTPLDRALPWFRRHVVLPLQVLAGVLLVMFIAGDADYRPDGFTTRGENLWQTAYWVTGYLYLAYLSAIAMRLLLVLVTDPRARDTIGFYTASMLLGLAGLTAQVHAVIVNSEDQTVAWALMCLAVMVFAYGSTRSWQGKTAWFDRDPSPTGPVVRPSR